MEEYVRACDGGCMQCHRFCGWKYSYCSECEEKNRVNNTMIALKKKEIALKEKELEIRERELLVAENKKK